MNEIMRNNIMNEEHPKFDFKQYVHEQIAFIKGGPIFLKEIPCGGEFVPFHGIPFASILHRPNNLELHQCYKNSVNFILNNPEYIIGKYKVNFMYCEGYATVQNCCPIEHAWVKINKTNLETNEIEEISYFDPTLELVVKTPIDKINEEQYIILAEYVRDDMIAVLLYYKRYGPWYREIR